MWCYDRLISYVKCLQNTRTSGSQAARCSCNLEARNVATIALATTHKLRECARTQLLLSLVRFFLFLDINQLRRYRKLYLKVPREDLKPQTKIISRKRKKENGRQSGGMEARVRRTVGRKTNERRTKDAAEGKNENFPTQIGYEVKSIRCIGP